MARSGMDRRVSMALRFLRKALEPQERRRGLPNDPDDTHSRYLEASVNGIIVGSIYLPNGNPQPGPKFDYKLAWFQRLIDHAAELVGQRRTGCPGGRLQRRADRWHRRHLLASVVPGRCVAAARDPGCVSPAAGAGVDRLDTQAVSGAADLHVLGLLQKPVAARCGASDRPSVAECASRGAAERGGGRQSDARPRKTQRSRARLGGPGAEARRRKNRPPSASGASSTSPPG